MTADLTDSLHDALRERFKHVDKNVFEQLVDEMELYEHKNADYARVGDKHGNFARVSALKRLYPKMDWAGPIGTALDYGMKQFDAAMMMLSNGYEGTVENVDTRLRDWILYLEIVRAMHKEHYV
jgi:hypothetical protein